MAGVERVHIIAIFYPAPGKVERLRNLLAQQCFDVHGKEDYALRFIVTESIDPDEPEFCLFETYASKEATNRHGKETHFVKMFETLKAEGLVEKMPLVRKTKTVVGFDLDRQMVASSST